MLKVFGAVALTIIIISLLIVVIRRPKRKSNPAEPTEKPVDPRADLDLGPINQPKIGNVVKPDPNSSPDDTPYEKL